MNEANHADLVLLGNIYTVNPSQPWVEAIAILKGEIIYTGNKEGAEVLINNNTQVIESGEGAFRSMSLKTGPLFVFSLSNLVTIFSQCNFFFLLFFVVSSLLIYFLGLFLPGFYDAHIHAISGKNLKEKGRK